MLNLAQNSDYSRPAPVAVHGGEPGKPTSHDGGAKIGILQSAKAGPTNVGIHSAKWEEAATQISLAMCAARPGGEYDNAEV